MGVRMSALSASPTASRGKERERESERAIERERAAQPLVAGEGGGVLSASGGGGVRSPDERTLRLSDRLER